jgi:hypothetical protein
LVIGKLYIDVHGKSQAVNHTTQETCDIDWKERGWTGKNANMMVGTVKSASGKPHYKVSGKFTEALYLLNMESNEEQELFRAVPKPDNHEFMYGFSAFTLQLNYLPDTLRDKLPPTDSRFRPDQRALEQGDTEKAIKEKHRLEEEQRERRR